jgi:predicted nucleotidyltransferase
VNRRIDGRNSHLLDELRRRRALIVRLAHANRIASVQIFGSVARGA